MADLKRAAIITSGGDAPGMNAAVRAVTLTALRNDIDVLGFNHGYQGILKNSFKQLEEIDVRNIIQMGGTIIKSARCHEFKTEEGAKAAAEVLDRNEVDVLFVVGGDGSFRGACHLSNYWKGQVIGIPGTIDNDIDGTDYTIGYFTAVDTAVKAIDKIRDTADAFDRIFLVEVMGRLSGFLATAAGIASGCEQIICPEINLSPDDALPRITETIRANQNRRGAASYIMVLAENYWPKGVNDLADKITESIDIDCKPIVLGYIQRGGVPVFEDRILATKLGVGAVERAMAGEHRVMIGEVSGRINSFPLDRTGDGTKHVDKELLSMQRRIFEGCNKS